MAACDAKVPVDVNDKHFRASKYQNFLACGAVDYQIPLFFGPAGPKIFEDLAFLVFYPPPLDFDQIVNKGGVKYMELP